MSARSRIFKPFQKRKPNYTWYHAALFFVGINLVERGLEAIAKKANPRAVEPEDDRAYYRTLKRPFFAPPGKAFPIAWAINDLFTLWGNIRVLNKPEGTPGRKTYLTLQAASWGIYSLFTALHFGLRSPLNALVLTGVHSGLNVASEAVALQKLNDKKVALSLAPVLSWLAIALPTAATIALWNQDKLYQKGPYTQPQEQWIQRQEGFVLHQN